MHQRLDFVDRRIQENGVTYNIYADPNGADRPWALDPLPLIISPEEWAEVSAAVAQRATLFNAMLADLYGEQTLLADGLLPPALVYGQHGYLWPCRGVRPPGGVWLHHYAVDLARSPDGKWWVIADRTQAPSGAGYALENRLLVSRVFPEMFRDLRVQHLADFFRDQVDGLSALAPVDPGEQPHTVLLTPGPYNETYFEHAYLARLMGCPLVEGRDLVVHDNMVYMRTTTGLRRIDVIYRRVDDDFIDPLTFRRDSALGSAGLFNAYRAGNVVICNAPGTGVADDKAVYAYVPAIIRYYLGEDAILPNIETYLCREPAQLSHVLANLDKLVVKAVGASGGYGMLVGPHASRKEREAFATAIAADPANYIAQPTIQLSTTPCLVDGEIEPRHVDLRPFILSGDKIVVTPGALTRVALKKGSLVVNSSQGGGTKDTWVLED